MRTVLYVSNLKSHADVRQLEQLFGSHGSVKGAQVFDSPAMFSCYGGFGIIQMGSHQEATAALAAMDGAEACGTVVAVRWATASEQTASGCPQMFSSMNMTEESNGYTCQ